MFDEVVKKVAGRRAARRASWIVVSAAAQVLLAVGALAPWRARPAAPRPERVVQVALVNPRLQPAVPPPPRARPFLVPRKPHPAPRHEPPRPVLPLLQPKEVPAEADLRPSDPIEAHVPEDPDRGGVVGGAVGWEGDGAASLTARDSREFDQTSMTRPVLVSGPDLAYTRRALEREVEGVMIVECVITAEGAVRACRVAQGLPYMDEAVVEALERRRYRPATLGGLPLEVRYVFRISLRMPR